MPVVFNATCSECEGILEVTRMRLDRDCDLLIEVSPCEVCMRDLRKELEEKEEEAWKGGYEEGFEAASATTST